MNSNKQEAVKSYDLLIADYKQEVSNLINKPGLSWGTKQMIFNEALMAVTNANAAAIKADRVEYEKAQEGVTEDGKEVH